MLLCCDKSIAKGVASLVSGKMVTSNYLKLVLI